jgi:hypothetical protein
MSEKTCSKCQTANPQQAVICWSCYTPLAAAAGAPAAAAAPVARPISREPEPRKKMAIAPWQMGAGGAVLLLVIGFGAMTFLGSGSEEDITNPDIVDRPATPINKSPTAPRTPNTLTPVVQAAPLSVNTGTSAAPLTPEAAPFSVVSAPNPRYGWGTMGIALTKPNSSPEEAAALAAFARQQMMRNRKWTGLHIYVFADRAAGMEFRRHQSQRKGAPLEVNDMQALASVWPKTLVRYEYNQGQEGYLVPSQNPGGWWAGKTNLTKAAV